METTYTDREANREAEAGELVNYRTYFVEERRGAYLAAKHQMIWFDSVSDMVECCKTNWENKTWDDRGYRGNNPHSGRDFMHSNHASMKWRFGTDFPDVETSERALLSGTGAPGGFEKVEQMKLDLFTKHPELYELERLAYKVKRKRTFSEDGGDLNIDRYMSGDIAMWENMSRRPQKTAIKIMINGTVSGDVSPETFLRGMIQLVAFLDILNAAGISSEVWYVPVGDKTNKITQRVALFAKIKGANEPLDIQKMLSIGLPALFRYYTFRIWCNIPAGEPISGFGRVLDNPAEVNWIKERYDFDVVLSANESEHSAYTILINKVKELI